MIRMESEIRSFYIKLHKLIENNDDIKNLNKQFKDTYGFNSFFKDIDKLQEFKQYLVQKKKVDPNIITTQYDLGDFQTPIEFAEDICQFISKQLKKPTILLEPTCGRGNFVIAALKNIDSIKYVYCIELQSSYEWEFKINLMVFLKSQQRHIEIEYFQEDIFKHQFSNTFLKNSEENEILILGNPPWVTNSALEKINSTNIPIKSNFKDFSGIDAITGKSNFDIAEFIITHLLSNFHHLNGHIVMLCKNTVIRNLMKIFPKMEINVGEIKQIRFNVQKIFNINANASIFMATLNHSSNYSCQVINFHSKKKEKIYGWYNGKFVANITKYKIVKEMEGKFPFEWRQGLKHDLSRIMVLKYEKDNQYLNGLKQNIQLEDNLIYPFLKSSDLSSKIVSKSRFHTIVTQEKVGADTSYIQTDYPKIWTYLTQNLENFQNRKSSIYKNKPNFSIFGIGKYSFAKYKIGVAGLYKNLNFALILPINDKSVMLDDTCYLIPFDQKTEAIITWTYLNRIEVKNFMESITFEDTKRPYTKEKLMRINLCKLIELVPFKTIFKYYKEKIYPLTQVKLSKDEFIHYINKYQTTK